MSAYALELRAVNKSFGALNIIRGVDLKVPTGERFAIIGPNGAGKTTLFNLISGAFGVTSGDILLNGQSIRGMRPSRSTVVAFRAAFRLQISFTGSACSRTCAARFYGRWGTAIRSGIA